MPRPNAPRPAPLQIDQVRLEHQDVSNERPENFTNRSQIVGNLNPDDIQTISDLGCGNIGYVTKVRHVPTNQVLARKVIRLEVNAAERNRIMQELEVLKECESEFVVGYFGACHKNGEINFFMEYMDCGSMDSILQSAGRIPESILGKMTISVIEGLTYLRDRLSIMHQNIKPSNILVNSHGKFKLCDFGVSSHLIDSIAQTFIGTKQYMSPERFTGEPYTVQSDIWSLGLSLVELALGMYPIPQHDPMRMYEGEPSPDSSKLSIFALLRHIERHPPPTIPGPPTFTSEFKDFIDKCLKRLPEERFDIWTIKQSQFVLISRRNHVDIISFLNGILDLNPPQ